MLKLRLLKLRSESPNLQKYNVIITHLNRIDYKYTLNAELSAQIS